MYVYIYIYIPYDNTKPTIQTGLFGLISYYNYTEQFSYHTISIFEPYQP